MTAARGASAIVKCKEKNRSCEQSEQLACVADRRARVKSVTRGKSALSRASYSRSRRASATQRRPVNISRFATGYFILTHTLFRTRDRKI